MRKACASGCADSGLKLTALLLISTCTACVSGQRPDQYEGVAAGAPHALVRNYGSVGGSTTTCQLPGASHVCRAYLLSVDGMVTQYGGSEIKVEPGSHIVALSCQYWRGGPMVFGKMQSQIRRYQVDLEEGAVYLVRATMHGDVCVPVLSNSESGELIGSVVSLPH